MPTASLTDVDLLRRLVTFDTVSHRSNVPIVEEIADYLDLPGARLERHPAPDGYSDVPKENLVVEIGPPTGEERRGLTLSGHVDVVPADEPGWTRDPFELHDAGDRLYGRGACDMKGFVALAINALRRWNERSAELRAPLALVLTYDEEVGTIGARHFSEAYRRGDRALPRRTVIGEPTSLRAVRLHKGHAKARVVVRGTPAHSGYPHLGHSALVPMARAVVALSEVGEELKTDRPPQAEHFPEVPFVALNLATLEAGSAINVVPDRAELHLGFRVLPGMDAGEVDRRLRQRLEDELDGEDWSYEPYDRSPPLLLDADHDLHRAVCSLHNQEETVSASYATDGGWLQEAGFDCVLYGPGDIGVAHKPDEWVPKDELATCASDLDRLIERYCVASS